MVVIAVTTSSGEDADPAALTAAGKTTLIPSPQQVVPTTMGAAAHDRTVTRTPTAATNEPRLTTSDGRIAACAHSAQNRPTAIAATNTV